MVGYQGVKGGLGVVGVRVKRGLGVVGGQVSRGSKGG